MTLLRLAAGASVAVVMLSACAQILGFKDFVGDDDAGVDAAVVQDQWAPDQSSPDVRVPETSVVMPDAPSADRSEGAVVDAGLPDVCHLACDGACVSSQNDPKNCGSCGNVCPGSQVCSDGTCRCPGGDVICGAGADAACVSLESEDNCGACGHACPPGSACVAGACVCLGEEAGVLLCSTDAGTEICANTENDPNNCGGCGVACALTQTCISGTRRASAGVSNLTVCVDGGASVNLRTSHDNCGTCGNACPASQVCADTACGCINSEPPCPDRTCPDFLNDSDNCGTCGKACLGGMICLEGNCACPSGSHLCSGECLPDNSPSSCGTSCTPCWYPVGGAPLCSGSTCGWQCPAGASKNCNGTCVNAQTSDASCGD